MRHSVHADRLARRQKAPAVAFGFKPNTSVGVLTEAGLLTGTGLAIGVSVALGAVAIARAFVDSVPQVDLASLMTGAGALAATVAAAAPPLLRALRVNPTVALRAE